MPAKKKVEAPEAVEVEVTVEPDAQVEAPVECQTPGRRTGQVLGRGRRK